MKRSIFISILSVICLFQSGALLYGAISGDLGDFEAACIASLLFALIACFFLSCIGDQRKREKQAAYYRNYFNQSK